MNIVLGGPPGSGTGPAQGRVPSGSFPLPVPALGSKSPLLVDDTGDFTGRCGILFG